MWVWVWVWVILEIKTLIPFGHGRKLKIVKRTLRTFGSDRYVIYLVWVKATWMCIIINAHQTEHVKYTTV